MPRAGNQFYLTEYDRTRVDRQHGRMRVKLPAADVDDSQHNRRAVGYAVEDIPSLTYGEIFLAKMDSSSPPVLSPSDFKLRGMNLASATIPKDTICFQEAVRISGGVMSTITVPGGVGIAKWIWGTNLQELGFGDSGLIRVVGGAEEQGSQQEVHYLAINGLEIAAEQQILAVYTLLDPADNTFGYLIVDAGCDEPPPLRWGGILEGGLPPDGNLLT